MSEIQALQALPDDVVQYNGGERCDMLVGPCACGAWHHGLIDDENAGQDS